MNLPLIRRSLVAAALVSGLAGAHSAAQAQSNLSAASALSGLPIALSVVAPVMLLSAGAKLTVVAVEASAAGSVWVLERASDGARATLRLSGQLAGKLSVAVGTAVEITVMSTGWLLSAAGAAVAFIPNEVGKALLYNERVTQ